MSTEWKVVENTNNGKEPVYDEWGVNVEWNNPRLKEIGIKEAHIEKANEHAKYWHYIVGANIIPCVGWINSLYLMKYEKYWINPMDEELFNHSLETGVFYYGIAVLWGNIWRGEHKGKWRNTIDYDNLKGQELILTDGNGVVHPIERLGVKTIIETNRGSPNRGHVYFITPRPLI
jgi:hypothetical protein